MSTPLRDLLTDIMFDPPSRAAFRSDPEGFLGDRGWSDLEGTDVDAALLALADELPVERATLAFSTIDGEAWGAGESAADRLARALDAVEDAPDAYDDPAGWLDVEQADPGDSLDADALAEPAAEPDALLDPDEDALGDHDFGRGQVAHDEPRVGPEDASPLDELESDDPADDSFAASIPWDDADEPLRAVDDARDLDGDMHWSDDLDDAD
ncbi:MAG: hypothetical protein ACT4OX_06110 [Actinomycetota bacterium]